MAINFAVSMDDKGHLMNSQRQMRKISLEMKERMILVIKWERMWLNCVDVQYFLEGRCPTFCGRQNLWVMKLDI